MTQHARRLQNADQALELYDFGPNKCSGDSDWYEVGPDQWKKAVRLYNGFILVGKMLFVVRFDPTM
jgi:hypothetical protein